MTLVLLLLLPVHEAIKKMKTIKNVSCSLRRMFFFKEEKVMLRSLLIILLFPITYASAQKFDSCEEYNKSCKDSSIVRLFTEMIDSVKYLDGEKVYLNPSHIFHTPRASVVCNGRSAIVLSKLSFDHDGYYIPCRKREDCTLKCSNPKCGYEWDIRQHASAYCPICGHAAE
jgi:hypothetical protein